MTRWLDDDQQRAWRAYINGSARLNDRLDRDLQDGHGLSLADYEVLVILSETDGRRLRMTELADSVLFSKSRLSHAVGRLERIKMVRRENCPEDKRGIYAVLTDEGYRRLTQAARTHVGGVRKYLVDLLTRDDFEMIGRAFAEVDRRLAE